MYLAFIFILFFIFSIYFSLKIRFFHLSFFDKFITTIFLLISLFLFTYSIFFGEFYLPPTEIEIYEKIPHPVTEKKVYKNVIIEGGNPLLPIGFSKVSYEDILYYAYIWKFPFLILFIYLVSYIFIYFFKKSKNNGKNLS